MRVATAALALSGAGLMITGVANAVTAPALAPGKVIDGPLDLPGAYADPTTDTAGDPADGSTTDPGAATTDPADGGSTDPAADPTTDPADPTTVPADPGTVPPGTATGTATASTGAGGVVTTAGPTLTGRSGGGSGMVQPPARQSLAETGSDDSVPFLLAGGFTLLAGGLVFRFGPRTAAPRHGA